MIITKKSDKMFSKKNGKAYYVVDINGKKFTVWEESHPEWAAFNQGDDVDIEFTVNGEFNNLTSMTKGTGQKAPVQDSNIDSTPNLNAVGTVMNFSDKPHSYEFGKAGNRHKVYYNTVEELKEHVEMLKAADLYLESNMEVDPKDFGKE